MSARQEIQELYEKWVALTEEEGFYIMERDWERVRRAQSGKAQLQVAITEAHGRWRIESPGSDFSESPFRAQIGKLISLENRNAAFLSDVRKQCESERQRLEQSQQNLHRVRKAYFNNPVSV